MLVHLKGLRIALLVGLAICISGAETTPLFAQDVNKSAQSAQQTDKKKKHAKQPAASRTRNPTTDASSAPNSQPAFPVNGY
jgi:hypothetical protein